VGLGGVRVRVRVCRASLRFGLKAFKAVGSSYALARRMVGEGVWPLAFTEVAELVPPSLLLVTATDGNHGFGVAFLAKWATLPHLARLFGCRARIVMPAGSVEERAQRIRDLGAECEVTKVNYDACVMLARELAKESGGLLLMDTAVEDDTAEERRMPLAIMQGYMTIVQEFLEQVQGELPTHVFLQAGVGSFSGGLAAHLRHVAKEARVVIVEAREADCIFQSVTRGDGAMVTIDGDLPSIMAGLCCGVPSVQGWPILRSTASAFLSCTDSVTAKGMRVMYRWAALATLATPQPPGRGPEDRVRGVWGRHPRGPRPPLLPARAGSHEGLPGPHPGEQGHAGEYGRGHGSRWLHG